MYYLNFSMKEEQKYNLFCICCLQWVFMEVCYNMYNHMLEGVKEHELRHNLLTEIFRILSNMTSGGTWKSKTKYC